jgi:hypothetical protein
MNNNNNNNKYDPFSTRNYQQQNNRNYSANYKPANDQMSGNFFNNYNYNNSYKGSGMLIGSAQPSRPQIQQQFISNSNNNMYDPFPSLKTVKTSPDFYLINSAKYRKPTNLW